MTLVVEYQFWSYKISEKKVLIFFNGGMQGRNHGENLGSPSEMVGRICPPGWDRVKVSENLGATAVAPVAPADTSLVN